MYWSARTYSKYSVRVALANPGDYAQAAAERGSPAVALTDRGGLGGAVKFYKACRKLGVEPVLGLDLPVYANRGLRALGGRMVFLATSEKGYRNVSALTRIAYVSNGTGALDLADLARAAEDGLLDSVACLTGGPREGFLDNLLTRGDSKSVRNVLAALAGWMGSGVWVELSPSVSVDVETAVETQDLVKELTDSIGIGSIISTGPRYLNPEDAGAWQTLNTLNQGTIDHLPATHPLHFAEGSEIRPWFTDKHWQAGITGLTELLALCKVQIPEMDVFTVSVPDVSAPLDPDKELFNKTCAELNRRVESGAIKAKDTKRYYDRFNEELEVIYDAGFSGYLLFTAAVTEKIRQKGILYNVRGSASASLLCWLLEISSIDPLEWGLPFDRFLSRDRAKPPDVDIDIDHARRAEVARWLHNAFPAVRVATFSTGKVSDSTPLTGSLVVQYKAMLKRVGKPVEGALTGDEEQRLRKLAQYEPILSVGVNAAGFVVAPDESALNTIPVMHVDSSTTTVTSFDKKDVEAIGFVKLDLLGVKTLTALQMLIDSTGQQWPAELSEPAVYSSMLSGNTGGLFQLEGKSSTIGVKRLKPKKFTDLVAAMALFRPALMNSGETDKYLSRRFRKEPVPSRHPLIAKHVAETYGVVLYQEQAISLLREMGMTAEEIEDARSAIKASNSAVGAAEARMRELLATAVEKGKAKGFDLFDLSWLSEVMQSYANYGFTKAHAVSYAQICYYTAWYKLHFPLHFWTCFLTVYVKTDNETEYLKEMRSSGIVIRGPHVNKSQPGYSIDADGKSVRKGLTSIKGVGEETARELHRNAPYKSIADLAARVNPDRVNGIKHLIEGHTPLACGGHVAALFAAGALADLPDRENL